MSILSEFLFAVCSSALIFSLITFLLPEKSGEAVRLVASVFVLTVILKSGVRAVSSLPEIKTELSYVTSEYDKNGYVEDMTETAIKNVVEERLKFAGCSYTDVNISVTYTEEGFSDLYVSVTVESEKDAETAQRVGRELQTEFDIMIG